LYAQLLIAASFALASYQDIKDRAVSDLVWIPAVAGVILAAYTYLPSAFQFDALLLKLGLAGAIIVVFYFLGMVGEADLIAIFFFFADPYVWSIFFAMAGVAAVMAAHMGFRAARHQTIFTATIPIEQFLREQSWVPKATIVDGKREEVDAEVEVARDEVEKRKSDGMLVEARYGVPTVAYFGIGYSLYLAALVILAYPLFVSLP
jgi:Flp pilus assembly protein protease CpaA